MAVPTTPLQVRKTLSQDLAAAIAVVEETWQASNAEDLTDKSMARLSADDAIATLVTQRQSEVWVADSDGVIAGVLGIDNTGYVWAIYVLPTFQRQGIGTALLDTAIKHFREAGVAALSLDILEKNVVAQAFYRAQGWQVEGHRVEHLPGEAATVIQYLYPL